MVKQVIVMRKDLNMRKGKMVAQGSHASLGVFLEMMTKERVGDESRYELRFKDNSSLDNWLNAIFTKICVSVDSERELMEIYDYTRISGLPVKLIEDNGITEFAGVKTRTCLAIGPAEAEEVDRVTGHLKLL